MFGPHPLEMRVQLSQFFLHARDPLRSLPGQGIGHRPTETECKADLDQFVAALTAIAREAETEPELLRQAPQRAKVRRLDEVQAARNPCLVGPSAGR